MSETFQKIFETEAMKKKSRQVGIDDVAVDSSDRVFHIVLGSCVSVVLCGKDETGKVWLGINHLFKSRRENTDMSLQHVADIYNSLTDRNIANIQCLGVFGGGYRERSAAKEVAKQNVMTVLEALSIYNLTIELFLTGYSQVISILKSDERNSFLIKSQNIDSRETEIIEIPLAKIFPDG